MVAFVSDPSKEGTKIEGSWVRPAQQSELLSEFKGWEREVESIVQVSESFSVFPSSIVIDETECCVCSWLRSRACGRYIP